MLFFKLFNQLEQESDRLVMPFDSQAHVAAISLDDFHIDKLVTQALNDAEQSPLHENVSGNLVKRELSFEDLIHDSRIILIVAFWDGLIQPQY